MQRCPARRVCHPLLQQRRTYAIQLQPSKPLPNVQPNRIRKSLKGHQYALYERILTEAPDAPVLLLTHDSFTANRIIKLRQDITAATHRLDKSQPLDPLVQPVEGAPLPPPRLRQSPTLTFTKSSVLGACLRNLPSISSSQSNLANLSAMTENIAYGYALLSFPAPFDPPQLLQTIKALEKSVPHRPPKPQAEIEKEEAAKKADPANPGRRSKRQRTLKTPDLRVVGAVVEGKVFLQSGVKDLSSLPTLERLREQLVGLLSQPGMQLTALLNEAAGAKLSRTLEGLKKSLEEDAGGNTSS